MARALIFGPQRYVSVAVEVDPGADAIRKAAFGKRDRQPAIADVLRRTQQSTLSQGSQHVAQTPLRVEVEAAERRRRARRR